MPKNNENFNLEIYQHGRCHLFALVLNELFNFDIKVLIDEDPFYENFDNTEEIPPALIHAYNTRYKDSENNICIDAYGTREEDFIFNDYLQGESIQLLEDENAKELILKWIEIGMLDDFEFGEKEKITQYLKNNSL